MASIVIADDDESMRILMSQSLEMVGHKVWIAEDGAEGIDLVREYDPDVFIVDANMPGLGGADAIADLRADGLDTPAILVTAGRAGQTFPELDAETHFLSKPFSPPKLAAFVAEVVSRSGR